jgi:hypothetical protein
MAITESATFTRVLGIFRRSAMLSTLELPEKTED